jgi:osmotically-inducible protein OsmY
MNRLRRYRWAWLVGSAALAGLGCSGPDADHLTRIAARVAEKVEHLAGGAQGKLASGLQAVRADLDETAVDTRVSARLRWDKDLQTCQIRVQVADGVAELAGTVATLTQRRRAVELTESTIGIQKVNDSLEVTDSAP